LWHRFDRHGGRLEDSADDDSTTTTATAETGSALMQGVGGCLATPIAPCKGALFANL
jgi:hypothetical protein